MGLFSDICPECGNKVSKRARFCSNCGHGAPDGWFKCPQCGKWVGNDSKFCPHCNHPLFPEDRINLAGGVWARKPGEFARRFELDDVRFIRENGLMVQEGTLAILMDGGKEVKELTPGWHHPAGTLRAINWFGNPPPRSAVMVDAGECVFRVDFTGKTSGVGEVGSAPLRSAEELEVGCVAEVTLRFVPGRGAEFIANVMREARSVSAKDVCSLIYENALSAVRDLCTQSKIEDLVKDPERRERFEDGITRALGESMKGWGLEIVRTGAVEFYGAAYEEVRAKYGELEKSRRLVEFNKAQLEVLAVSADQDAAAGKRDAKRDQDTKEYLEQLAQEKQLSEIERKQELEIAVRLSNGEVSAAEAKLAAARELEEHAKQMTALAHKLELDLTLRNYNREQELHDAEHKAKLAAIGRDERLKDAVSVTAVKGEELKQAEIEVKIAHLRSEHELWEAREWAKLKNEIDSAKLKRKMDWANLLRDYPEEKLLAIVDDPQMRQDLQQYLQRKHEVETLRIKQGMTADQIMAMNAGGANAQVATAAANAWAFAQGAKENASAQVLAEVKRQEQDRIAHDEKVLDKIAEIAKTSAEHQQTTVVQAPSVTNMQH